MNRSRLTLSRLLAIPQGPSMKQFCSKLLVIAVVVSGLMLPSPAHAQGRRIDYNRDIRPILSDLCYKCHGPDEKERKAGLRLDTQLGVEAKVDSGLAVIVPRKSAESELFVRITATDPNEKMPPPALGKTLSPQQIDLIKRWIDEGATMRGHWSFVAPVRTQPPVVKNEAA